MHSTLFINAKVWQPDGSFDGAFGINGGHFDFTGSTQSADKVKGRYDNVADLGGRLVLPGLIDGHLHLVHGSLMRKRFDGSKITGIESLKTELNAYVNKHPSQSWLIGGNLNLNTILMEVQQQTGNFADNIYSHKPLFITNYDYHSAICNTKALELSGILKKPGEFSGDEVVRDSAGNPTGLIKEKALDFLFDNLPRPSLDERVSAVCDFIEVLHSCGITAVTDITLIEDLEVYNRLKELGKLNIRINSYIPFEEFPNIEKHKSCTAGISPGYYSICGFKTFWDGALGSETALYSQNYKGQNHNGYKTDIVESGEVYDIAKSISDSGMQMIIHAIGDKAVTEVLDMYESLRTPGKKTRHRIEHAQHIQQKDIERFKELGVIASVQPLHLKYDAATVKEKLPEGLVTTTHNYKMLIDSGAVVNFGTDFPIVEVSPFENIRLAVTRNAGGEVFLPEYSIGLHDCIKCYTINNAVSNFNENAIGSITKGKAADFAVMEDNIFEMEPGRLCDAKVYKTYLDGREVYSA